MLWWEHRCQRLGYLFYHWAAMPAFLCQRSLPHWQRLFIDSYWMGSEQASPRCAALARGLLWAEGNQVCVSARDIFTSALSNLSKALPIIRVTTRDNLLGPVYRAGQMSSSLQFVLLIVLWIALLPSEAPGVLTYSLAQYVIYTSFHPSVSKPPKDAKSLTLIHVGFLYAHTLYLVSFFCWSVSCWFHC